MNRRILPRAIKRWTIDLVAVFFCLDALFGERRDRSILFWKSLPVSDLKVVLSKMTIPVVVIPVVCFLVTLATQAVLILIGALLMWSGGMPAMSLRDMPLVQMSGMLFVYLFALQGIWFAPMYAWLLLVAAWAKRAPLLWAILPPAGIAIVERIAYRTSYFAEMLRYRFKGGFGAGFDLSQGHVYGMVSVNLGQFFMSPGLWGGLFVAGVFLAGAVRLRRYRGPI